MAGRRGMAPLTLRLFLARLKAFVCPVPLLMERCARFPEHVPPGAVPVASGSPLSFVWPGHGAVNSLYGASVLRQFVVGHAVGGIGRKKWRQKTRKGKKHSNESWKVTLQNQSPWRNRPAFCLSVGIFPFIVLHGQCPVPVVQWIERVSPKD